MNPFRLLYGLSPAALWAGLSSGPARSRKVIGETLRAARPEDPVRRVSPWDLFRGYPASRPLLIHADDWTDGSTAPLERMLIAQMASHFQPATVVEIGTYRGGTTRLLLDQLPESSCIHTMDLPPEVDALHTPGTTDSRLIQHRVLGRAFQDHPRSSQITQHLGDSMKESTWDNVPQSIDLAFIDASHSYLAVKNDTEKVLARASKDAIILWHDYSEGHSEERGVGTYIRELMKTDPTVVVCHDTDTALKLPASTIAGARERIRASFPDGDYATRHPKGFMPWLA